MRPAEFKQQARTALNDTVLRQALGKARSGFVDRRAQAVAQVPEFEQLRDEARAIKNYSLAHLGELLEQYEQQVQAVGGQVHWAETAGDAQRLIVDLCTSAGARKIAKGKSMVGEEIELNEALEGAGLEVIETDLGEYIIQLAEEPPSHIIAPAVHKTKEQITELFERHHPDLHERLTEVADMVNEARQVLREQFLTADVGITGANFLIAETGSHVLVTNEGNGDLSSTLPRVHIVTAGIEKVVPSGATRPPSCACSRAAPPARRSPSTPAGLPGRSGQRTWTARRNSTWCCSTTAAARCSPASSATCCAVSAAGPV